ncbi:hypothetical protein [Hoeflea olei]|uniref:CopL family metal-binding regulatory protein n=1 Tax=Hoeflea olei TaxID=1480615 RepID=A0A1C1YQX2_9HYPH|nr:hypothetical protein [Hoeflea olei]OCW55915.1 hypothetical protein AWJ14_11805 [Hoeflea olei]
MRTWIAIVMLVALALAFVVPAVSGHGAAVAPAEAMSHEGMAGMAQQSETMSIADQAGMPDACCPGSDIKHRGGHGAACDLHCLMAIPAAWRFEPVSGSDFVAPASQSGTGFAPHFAFRPPIAA